MTGRINPERNLRPPELVAPLIEAASESLLRRQRRDGYQLVSAHVMSLTVGHRRCSNLTIVFDKIEVLAVYVSIVGRGRELALGFVARTIFWLGLVYSSMPFDEGSAPGAARRQGIASAALPDPVAACAQGSSADCRAAVDRLRLAADVAAASLRAGDALRKAASATSRLADGPTSKDKASPAHGPFVQPADSR